MIRNECDIVEIFIKVNSRHASQIVIVDHASDDGTTEILRILSKSNPKIRVVNHKNPNFQQSKIITQIVNQLANENTVDYIVPLDADEFLASTKSEFDLISRIPELLTKDQVGTIEWQTYCPISFDYFEKQAPIYSNFRKRSIEPESFSKLIIGNEYAKTCIISEGNHVATHENLGFDPVKMPFTIQHVPVRSSEQIISKAIIGSYQLSLKNNRLKGEGFHWDKIAKIVRENDYSLTECDLANIALNYACETENVVSPTIDFDSNPIGNDNDHIEFKELSKSSAFGCLDKYINNLIAQLSKK